MKKEILIQYKAWVNSTGKHLRKWPILSDNQRWYVYMNSRQVAQPLVSKARTVKEVVGMIWSRTN